MRLSRLINYQGACQAIEDATELANALQAYFSSNHQEKQDLERTLNDYSQNRGERAKALVSFSENYAKVHTANLPYGLGPLVRKLIFGYLPESVWMWGLTWLYGYQPTVNNVRHHLTVNISRFCKEANL